MDNHPELPTPPPHRMFDPEDPGWRPLFRNDKKQSDREKSLNPLERIPDPKRHFLD